MTGASNAIIGDHDEPTKLPETQVPAEELLEEKKLAKYSRTAEFKRLREFIEARISYYRNFLPETTFNGTTVGQQVKDSNQPPELLAFNWKVASAVCTEFQNIIDEYDRSAEAVKDASR